MMKHHEKTWRLIVKRTKEARDSLSSESVMRTIVIIAALNLALTFYASAQPWRPPESPYADDFPVETPSTSVGGPRAAKDYPIVDTPNYKGAIVPADEASRHRSLTNSFHGFWTPTPEEIGKAEAKVTAFIDAATSDTAAGIRKKFKRFRRQYVGYTADGEKRILCSFLPGFKEGKDPFGGLRRSFITVYDGGQSFWQIHYRVDKDECDKFHVDGGF